VGAGLFAFPHTIRVDAHDNLWLVDRDHGQMMYFTPEGKLLRTIGAKGFRSDTGVDPGEPGSTAYRKVTHGGGPFNLPTDIALARSGEMFITDGYGNARVHKFAADGTHLDSWGEPGSAPGQFMLPHGVWIDVASAPGRPVSESGRLSYGDGAHGRGGRRRMLLMSPSLLVCRYVDEFTVEALNDAEGAVAKLHCAGEDRVEDQLDIRRGLADYLQNLARRRLLLQRLRKFAPESFGFLCTVRLSTRTLSAGKTLAKPFDFLD